MDQFFFLFRDPWVGPKVKFLIKNVRISVEFAVCELILRNCNF